MAVALLMRQGSFLRLRDALRCPCWHPYTATYTHYPQANSVAVERQQLTALQAERREQLRQVCCVYV